MERILNERPGTRVYKSMLEWKNEHPNCLPIVYAFVELNFKQRKEFFEDLLPRKGEYTWGDYTEIKYWDSPVEFAREHAQSHIMPNVREHFVADLAKKMAPRFKQGYLIEVVGLRDKDGRDVSCAMSDEKCPKSVYHVEMERREVGRKLTQATSNLLRRFEERRNKNKGSLWVGDGIPFRAMA